MSQIRAPIASPCNSVCRIDPRTGLCEGCFRTLDEIARWSTIDDAQKRAVRDALRLRRRALRAKADSGEAPP